MYTFNTFPRILTTLVLLASSTRVSNGQQSDVRGRHLETIVTNPAALAIGGEASASIGSISVANSQFGSPVSSATTCSTNSVSLGSFGVGDVMIGGVRIINSTTRGKAEPDADMNIRRASHYRQCADAGYEGGGGDTGSGIKGVLLDEITIPINVSVLGCVCGGSVSIGGILVDSSRFPDTSFVDEAMRSILPGTAAIEGNREGWTRAIRRHRWLLRSHFCIKRDSGKRGNEY